MPASEKQPNYIWSSICGKVYCVFILCLESQELFRGYNQGGGVVLVQRMDVSALSSITYMLYSRNEQNPQIFQLQESNQNTCISRARYVAWCTVSSLCDWDLKNYLEDIREEGTSVQEQNIVLK